jgi:MFS family permease
LSIWLIFFLTIFTHLSFAGCRFILALTAIHFEATPFTIGVILSLLAIVPMIFAVSWGRFIDRVGVQGPMLGGVAAILAAMILGWAVPRLEILFVVSTVAGSGFILFHIAVTQAAAVIGMPEQRVRNFSLLALAFSASSTLGPILAGFAVDGVGHQGAFLALAAGAMINLIVLSGKHVAVPRQDVPAPAAANQRLIDFVRLPGMLPVFIVAGSLSIAWDLFTFVMPIYGTRIGLSASAIGLILGVFGIAVFVVRLILPLVAPRVREWSMLIGAMFVTGAVLVAFPVVESVELLMILAFLLGLGLGGTQPLVLALLYERAPPGRGAEAIGIRTLLLNFAQAGVPLAFGALGSALGMVPVFWAMGAGLVAAAYAVNRRR